MKNTAEYYESKVLDIIERLDENAHITVATFAMQSIQVFATLAQAAATSELRAELATCMSEHELIVRVRE